jgi:hypothetical protein
MRAAQQDVAADELVARASPSLWRSLLKAGTLGDTTDLRTALMRAASPSMLLLTLGCVVSFDGPDRAFVAAWPSGSLAKAVDVAATIEAHLGFAPDTLQWCAPARVRVVFVNAPMAMAQLRHPDTTLMTDVRAQWAAARAIAIGSATGVSEAAPDSLTVVLAEAGANGSVASEFHMALRELVTMLDTVRLSSDRRPCTRPVAAAAEVK